IMADSLGWPPRSTVTESLHAARPYLSEDLAGEAVLTLGSSVHEWRSGHVDGVVSVGPLECMPNKIAEAQFFHVAENEGLVNLTIPVNGDPLDPEIIDAFAYEVKARYRGCISQDSRGGYRPRRDNARSSVYRGRFGRAVEPG
ncbi:MAG: hypothetical protein IFK93_08810, partial [Acidobacteria bacterium]|nr:hypothetical protein [Candidatus Sulfomarinibacter kjeldsenii]